MKLLKSKFATAFVLAGLMFGMLSFSTTPVSAQDTFSDAAVMEEELALGRMKLLKAAGYAAMALGYAVVEGVTYLLGGSATLQEDIPQDSLDY